MLNNGGLGLVRQLQHHYCNDDFFAVDMPGNPDFVVLAEAYGIPARRVETKEEAQDAFRALLAAPGPMLLECTVPADELVYPVVLAGCAADEMLLEDE